MAKNQAAKSDWSGANLVISKAEGVTIVDFHDAAVLDGQAVEAISRDLYALIDQHAARKVLLDFRRVQFLSSRMIGVLTEMHKRAGGIKGKVVICGMRPNLFKVFQTMRLDKLLHFAPDGPEAMRLFSP